jgi:hypothetical protein
MVRRWSVVSLPENLCTRGSRRGGMALLDLNVQGVATSWPQGVASIQTPYLHTIPKRRGPLELIRGMQRPIWRWLSNHQSLISEIYSAPHLRPRCGKSNIDLPAGIEELLLAIGLASKRSPVQHKVVAARCCLRDYQSRKRKIRQPIGCRTDPLCLASPSPRTRLVLPTSLATELPAARVKATSGRLCS